MQVHSLLHCLSEVLLHADGEDAILYAQVAQLRAELLFDTARAIVESSLPPSLSRRERRLAYEKIKNEMADRFPA